MKVLLTAVVILILSFTPVTAQEPAFPTCNLDLQKVIDIVADYDVEHQSSIYAGQYWGLTDPNRKKIYLSNEPDAGLRKVTLIHELLHVCYNYMGISTSGVAGEQVVEARSVEMYRQLYGGAQ